MAGNSTSKPPRHPRWAPNGAPSVTPRAQYAGRPSIALSRTVTIIGARDGARLHLVSSTVSNLHALLVNTAAGAYVRDLASRTHVIVNGHTVRESDVNDGDALTIGKFQFRFNAGNPEVFAGGGRSIADQTDPAPAAVLKVDGAPVLIPITERTVLIGRKPTCDIPLLEESASQIHAVLFELNGRRYVRDLMSRTGVYVNGERINEQAEIALGDELRVGDTNMRYLAAEASPATAGEPRLDADARDAGSPSAGGAKAAHASAAGSMAPLALAGDDDDDSDTGATPAAPFVAAAPAEPAAARDEGALARAGDEHRDQIDLDADPDVAGPGETVELPAAAVARDAQVAPPALSELVIEQEPVAGEPVDDMTASAVAAAAAGSAVRVYDDADARTGPARDAADGDGEAGDDLQPRRGWRGMSDSAAAAAVAAAAGESPADDAADAAAAEAPAAEADIDLAAGDVAEPDADPPVDVTAEADRDAAVDLTAEADAEIDAVVAAGAADDETPAANTLELAADRDELEIAIVDDAADVAAAAPEPVVDETPEPPAGEPVAAALDLSGGSAAGDVIVPDDAGETAEAVEFVLPTPTGTEPAAAAADELALTPVDFDTAAAADRPSRDESAAEVEPDDAVPPIAPIVADAGAAEPEPEPVPEPPLEIATLDLQPPPEVAADVEEVPAAPVEALPLGDDVSPVPPIAAEAPAFDVIETAEEKPATSRRRPRAPRKPAAEPTRRSPRQRQADAETAEAAARPADVAPPIAEPPVEPPIELPRVAAEHPGEVLEPTEPTPESALDFGDAAASSEAPSAADDVVAPDPAGALSDSTFGRAVEDFSGASTGPLVDAAADDDVEDIAADALSSSAPPSVELISDAETTTEEMAASALADEAGEEPVAAAAADDTAASPQPIELPDLRLDAEVEAESVSPAVEASEQVPADADSDAAIALPMAEVTSSELPADPSVPEASAEPESIDLLAEEGTPEEATLNAADVSPVADAAGEVVSSEPVAEEPPPLAPPTPVPSKQPPLPPPRHSGPRAPAPAMGGSFGWGANQEHFLGGMPLSLGANNAVTPPPARPNLPRGPKQPPQRPAARGPAGPGGRNPFTGAPGKAVPPFAGATPPEGGGKPDGRKGQLTTGFDGLAMPPVRETDVFSQMSTPTAFASGLAPGAIEDVFGGRQPAPGDNLGGDPPRGGAPPAGEQAPVAAEGEAASSAADPVWNDGAAGADIDDDASAAAAAAAAPREIELTPQRRAASAKLAAAAAAAEARRARAPQPGRVDVPPAKTPDDEPPAPPARPRRRWFGFRGLLVLMILVAAGAAAGVYRFTPEQATLEASMAFGNFEPLRESDRRNLLAEQRKHLADPALRQSAASTLVQMRPDSAPGFLADPATFAKTASTADWSASRPGVLVIRHEGSSSVAERARVLALMTALYHKNMDRAAVASTVRAEVERLTNAHAATQRRVEELKGLIDKYRAAAEARPPAPEIQQLEAEAARLEAAWNAALARVKDVGADLDRLRQAMPAEPQPAGAADAPVVDPDLAKLEGDLQQLHRQIAAARDARGRRATDARGALDAALAAFETEIAGARRTMAANPDLAAYVAAADKLRASTRELTDQLTRRQQQTQARLTELKQRLAEKMDARRTDAWKSDPQLKDYGDQLAITTRRYNAAVGSGLTKEAEELKAEIVLTQSMIRARQTMVGDNAFYADAIEELQRVIDDTQRDLANDRRRTEQQLEAMQRDVTAAQPAVAKLSGEQKAQAERLEQRLKEVGAARRAYTSAADAAAGPAVAKAGATRPAGTPGAVAAAAAHEDDDDELRQLEAAAEQMAARVNDRKALLAGEVQKQLVARAEQARLAEIKERETALAAAREAEVAAQAAAVDADRKRRDAQTRLADARVAAERLDEHMTERDAAQKDLAQTLAALEQKRTQAARQVEPVQPTEDDVRLQRAEDKRPTYALAAAGGVVVVFSLLMLLSSRGGGGDGDASAARTRPEMIDDVDSIPYAEPLPGNGRFVDGELTADHDNGHGLTNGDPADDAAPTTRSAHRGGDAGVGDDERRALS